MGTRLQESGGPCRAKGQCRRQHRAGERHRPEHSRQHHEEGGVHDRRQAQAQAAQPGRHRVAERRAELQHRDRRRFGVSAGATVDHCQIDGSDQQAPDLAQGCKCHGV